MTASKAWALACAGTVAFAACYEPADRPAGPGRDWDDATAARDDGDEDDQDQVAPYGCVTDIAAGHSVFACTGPDVSCVEPGACPITYDVEVPEDCLEGGCGLIVEIHGGAQFAGAIDQITGMRERGSARDFIVVQPNGPYPFVLYPVFRLWYHLAEDLPGVPDDGYPPSVIRQERDEVVSALHDFLQDVITAYAVDEHDAHVTGFSQGGGLTWDLVCAFPDLFASAAPVSADGPASPTCFDGTGPEGDVPILRTHGLFDRLNPYDLAEPRVADMVPVLGFELEEQRCYGDRAVGEENETCPYGTVSRFEAEDGADVVIIAHTQTSNADGIENCEKRFGTRIEDEDGNVSCFGGFPEPGGHCYPGVGGADPIFQPNGLASNLFQWLAGCGVDPNLEPLPETILDFFEYGDIGDDDDEQ